MLSVDTRPVEATLKGQLCGLHHKQAQGHCFLRSPGEPEACWVSQVTCWPLEHTSAMGGFLIAWTQASLPPHPFPGTTPWSKHLLGLLSVLLTCLSGPWTCKTGTTALLWAGRKSPGPPASSEVKNRAGHRRPRNCPMLDHTQVAWEHLS